MTDTAVQPANAILDSKPNGGILTPPALALHCHPSSRHGFFGLIRYRLRDMPLERDEGEYALSGPLMLQGVPPYRFAYNATTGISIGTEKLSMLARPSQALIRKRS